MTGSDPLGWARRVLGARSDLIADADTDTDDYVLAGAYLPLSAMTATWQKRARPTRWCDRRLAGSEPCCAGPTASVRLRLASDGCLELEGRGSLARLLQPQRLAASDARRVAHARLASASSSINDGVAILDIDDAWWVLVPAPGSTAHPLSRLEHTGWPVAVAPVTYRLRLFDHLVVDEGNAPAR